MKIVCRRHSKFVGTYWVQLCALRTAVLRSISAVYRLFIYNVLLLAFMLLLLLLSLRCIALCLSFSRCLFSFAILFSLAHTLSHTQLTHTIVDNYRYYFDVQRHCIRMPWMNENEMLHETTASAAAAATNTMATVETQKVHAKKILPEWYMSVCMVGLKKNYQRCIWCIVPFHSFY